MTAAAGAPLHGSDSVGLLDADPAAPLQGLLDRRRSIRRLRDVDLAGATVARLTEAVRLTPAAYNLPPWHVVLVRERRAQLWAVVEAAMRASLEGDRLARNLDRLAGLRSGAGLLLVYEDATVQPRLRDAWRITDEQATAFVQQGLGMVQLALWLALTEEGLVASLQHWDWLVPDGFSALVGLPADRFALAVAIPFGAPDEAPRPTDRPEGADVVSRERYGRT